MMEGFTRKACELEPGDSFWYYDAVEDGWTWLTVVSLYSSEKLTRVTVETPDKDIFQLDHNVDDLMDCRSN